MRLTPGTRLGSYEIICPLGAGGMGEVYRARDLRLGREVAIKTLPEGLAGEPERLSRFEREARLLASLNHPNVGSIYGLEEVEGHRYLVLEYVEGETLAARIARGALPVEEALEVCRQVATGVEAAHEAGVVHRDLKPGNVMLKGDGSVKVLDFGLAKSGADAAMASSDPKLSASPTMTYAATNAGVILGTAAYMSPEQARGRAVDKRSDVWSFGCVLYECLTGRQAFHGETVSDTIAGILKGEVDLGALPADTPAGVRELLARCLCKDPRERLRDIGEARVLLGSVRVGGATPSTMLPAARRGVPLWLAAGGALALATLAVITTLQVRPGHAPSPVRKLDLVAEDIETTWYATPQISPDGAKVAYVARGRIWVRDLQQLEPRAVADVRGVGAICWSPDSRYLAFNDQRKLWKVPAAGGAPVILCDVPGTGGVLGIAWSARGTVVFPVYRGAMYSVSAAGGPSSLLLDIDPRKVVDYHSPSWLPNGDLMYTVHWSEIGDSAGSAPPAVEVFAAGRRIPVAADFISRNSQPMVTASGRLLYLSETNAGVWVVGYDERRRRTTGVPQLVAAGAASLSASNDGSLLYLEGASAVAATELVWVDRSGKVLGQTGSAHPGISGATLSPDGRRVAFSAERDGSRDIWVRDLARGIDTRVTFSKAPDLQPLWLGPDRLSYLEQIRAEQCRILTVKADGSGGQGVLASPQPGGHQEAHLAPDGTTALRVIDGGGHGRLRISPVSSDGSLGPPAPFLQYTPDPEVDEARLAPNGRLFAYSTDAPGEPQMFVTQFPSGQGRWQVSAEGARQPRWARGTGALYFIEGGESSRRWLDEVSIDPSQDPPIGRSTRLFELDATWSLPMADMSYDAAPDGRSFLITSRSPTAASHPGRMVLVQNWESELQGGDGH